MALDRITLSHFRNHRETRLDGTARINVLIGENGAGKTNVLEALSLFAPGRGLRRAPLADIAGADGPGTFAVSAMLEQGDGADAVVLGTGTQPDRPARRKVQVNGADTSAIALGEWLAVGWLTPAMDGLFVAAAGERRRYMDRLAVALDPAHARHASRFEASLRERNRLLAGEHEPDPAWIASVERQMAAHGAALAEGRVNLVARLAQALADLPEQPFARPVLTYQPGGPTSQEALTHAFLHERARDRAAQRTLIGPHRDDLLVRMAGKGMPAALSSTGEQKAMLIALTLAHAELAARGRPGVLLLDEVAAHLDPLRREALFARLDQGAAQVWLTGTERAPFEPMASSAAVWQVTGGAAHRR